MAIPLPILLALVILYGPSYWDLAHGLWRTDEHAHAPLIALVCVWLAWRARARFAHPCRPEAFLGSIALGLGLLVYIGGRAFHIPLLEIGSQIPVFSGLLLILGGKAWLHALRFPLAFLAFMLPIPGILMDAVTSPLKTGISMGAEELLYLAGYPIARNGVTLSLSQYKLLVADACSGLYSMISLSALGLLFIHLAARNSRIHNVLLIGVLLPIAFFSNLARVVFILLATYHWGDRVGQGPIHDLAGIGVFLLALAMLFAIDAVLSRLLSDKQSQADRPDVNRSEAIPAAKAEQSAPLALSLLTAAGLAIALQPGQPLAEQRTHLDLETLIPRHFSGWRLEADMPTVQPNEADTKNPDRLYSHTLARTYVDAEGRHIMLSIAYGADQSHDGLQVHRPEYCYQAQGFTLQAAEDRHLGLASASIPVRRLVAVRYGRIEPLTYWMVVGGEAVLPGISRKLTQVRQALAGRIPDGLLVRVSSIDSDPEKAYEHQERFIHDLLAAVDDDARILLAAPPAARITTGGTPS